MNNQLAPKKEQQQFTEYSCELEKLEAQGLKPIGINDHLESFSRFLEWKKRVNLLFDTNDSAKDLF